MIAMCCKCRRVRDYRAENRDENYRLPDETDLKQQISHGYCPPCYEIEIAKVIEK